MSSLIVYPNVEQRSEEWHDQRRGMVTASVVGSLVTPKTMKPASNDTSRGLTLILAAERITGYTEDSYVNADMWRGIVEEPRARDMYAEHYGVTVTEVGFMVREFDDGIRLGYSPDGLVGDVGCIEIKAPRQKSHLETVLADEVPGQYVAQVQTALLVSGRAWCDYVSFCAEMPLYVKRVYPDPKWHAAITEALVQFEDNAAKHVATFNERTAGMPVPPRISYEEITV